MIGVYPVFLADQWKPLNLEEKKRYDREFLLGFQFIFASMQKPEGLPHISDVVLDKVGGLEGEAEFMLANSWGRNRGPKRAVSSLSLFLILLCPFHRPIKHHYGHWIPLDFQA